MWIMGKAGALKGAEKARALKQAKNYNFLQVIPLSDAMVSSAAKGAR